MCIRDSYSNASTEYVNGSAEEKGTEAMIMTVTIKDKPHTCLLYTSDAADERSSVDLGGRRIIKKKKHSTTKGSV